MPQKTPEEKRAYNSAYYAAHREQRLAYHAAYRATHLEKRHAVYAAWHAAHREERCAQIAAWRLDHRDACRAYDVAYDSTHREERCRQEAARRIAHPEIHRTKAKRRRARKAAAAINDLTHAQWIEMQAAFDHCCAYCGKHAKGKLSQDHITPLSQGGNHTLNNIVPACKSCNSKKHTGPPLQPVQPLLLTCC